MKMIIAASDTAGAWHRRQQKSSTPLWNRASCFLYSQRNPPTKPPGPRRNSTPLLYHHPLLIAPCPRRQSVDVDTGRIACCIPCRLVQPALHILIEQRRYLLSACVEDFQTCRAIQAEREYDRGVPVEGVRRILLQRVPVGIHRHQSGIYPADRIKLHPSRC
jgi:hypothetical protein